MCIGLVQKTWKKPWTTSQGSPTKIRSSPHHWWLWFLSFPSTFSLSEGFALLLQKDLGLEMGVQQHRRGNTPYLAHREPRCSWAGTGRWRCWGHQCTWLRSGTGWTGTRQYLQQEIKVVSSPTQLPGGKCSAALVRLVAGTSSEQRNEVFRKVPVVTMWMKKRNAMERSPGGKSDLNVWPWHNKNSH